ncbi:hypothetical protein GCM10023336_24930 [Streptomyces similanensis]|uniref:Uncharacterized protein n=1 Tax=Streptomyces similanensis TaxID=1274988 RepID=A0ABP9KCV3_9ACTN
MPTTTPRTTGAPTHFHQRLINGAFPVPHHGFNEEPARRLREHPAAELGVPPRGPAVRGALTGARAAGPAQPQQHHGKVADHDPGPRPRARRRLFVPSQYHRRTVPEGALAVQRAEPGVLARQETVSSPAGARHGRGVP